MYIIYLDLGKLYNNGGEVVAKETVEAIRLAELNAAEREKEAIQKREMILFEAQQSSAALITSMAKEALLKAQRDVNEAINQGDKNLEIAKQESEKEAFLLKEMAQKREQEAIKLVLSNVI